ncbi:dihydropteridine reductase, partial [Acinetobacter baumannii 107m]
VYFNLVIGTFSQNTESPTNPVRFTFIALGQLLFAAGLEGIDATPMGGFDENVLNEEFGLKEKGLRSSVIVSLGYRSENDFNAKLPKSRLPDEVIFTHL